MRSRQPPAPLTEDDCAIWCEVYLRAGRRPERGVVPAVNADRRDADLMFELMKGRKTFRESRRSYERLRRYALSIGGSKTDWPE